MTLKELYVICDENEKDFIRKASKLGFAEVEISDFLKDEAELTLEQKVTLAQKIHEVKKLKDKKK